MDSLPLSRFTLLTATVTISAPDSSSALTIISLVGYFPVPTISRDLNSLFAIFSISAIGISPYLEIGDLIYYHIF